MSQTCRIPRLVAGKRSDFSDSCYREKNSGHGIKSSELLGAWVAQSVQRLTFDFCSGRDLGVGDRAPRRALGSAQSLLEILSLPLLLPPLTRARALSLSNK